MSQINVLMSGHVGGQLARGITIFESTLKRGNRARSICLLLKQLIDMDDHEARLY